MPRIRHGLCLAAPEMTKQITILSGKYPGGVRGGHESLVRATARAACSAGFEPHIFCAAPTAGVTQCDYGYVHYVASPFRPFGSKMIPWQAPLLSASVERFLEDKPGPQLIHAFCVWGYVAVRVGQRLKRKGIDVVSVINSYDIMASEARAKLDGLEAAHGWRAYFRFYSEYLWQRLIVRRYERYAYARAQVVIVNYEAVRKLIIRAHGDRVHVRRLPYTAETAFLQPEMTGAASRDVEPEPISTLENRDSPLIVTASRHSPRKGLNYLIQALALLRDSGLRFRACLVGGGSLLSAHARLIDRLGLQGAVTVTGVVPDSFAYIRSADIFVLPSIEEGSGSVSLIEALQAGKAIVASNVDGIPDDVINGKSALLVNPGNTGDLAAAIGKLLSDSELRQRLGCAARATFVDRFSPAAFTTALKDLYAELGFTP
jgi:glycosyltransferase involved in cell wall biosynthesis